METEEYERMYRMEDWYWWFVGKRNFAKSLLDRYVRLGNGATILDVGCGTGAMLKFLNTFGMAVGVDISEVAMEFCRKRELIRLVQASALELPFDDSSFDLITAFDVLYHKWVNDDLRALGEFYRVCKPGGWILITDSAFRFLLSEHDIAVHARTRYTAGELGGKMVASGFNIEKISYTNMSLFPLVLMIRLYKKMFRSKRRARSDLQPLNPVLNKALIALLQVEAVLLQKFGLPFGSSVVCVARKPIRVGRG